MQRRYLTTNVFTTNLMGGNPAAVVLDAEGLSTTQMQVLAAGFNYPETAFVLSASDPAFTARVRIFTPDRELPFAAHPSLGTAFLLARERVLAGDAPPERLVLEEAAGSVAVDLVYHGLMVVGADLMSPKALVRHTEIDEVQAAACLSLAKNDVRTIMHMPQVVSVGLPFLAVDLASHSALRRARPDRNSCDALFPLDGARSVYAYTRDAGDDVKGHRPDLHARMFTGQMLEDPATGSAAAAVTALLADLTGADVRLCIRQGEDMGRPSTLLARSVFENGAIRARVGGQCVPMFRGLFDLP